MLERAVRVQSVADACESMAPATAKRGTVKLSETASARGRTVTEVNHAIMAPMLMTARKRCMLKRSVLRALSPAASNCQRLISLKREWGTSKRVLTSSTNG